MERMTTDNPKTNTEVLLNFVYAKDQRVYLRYADGEENKDLCEYVSNYACSKGCAGTFPQDVMEGSCLECDCEMALLYVAAVQAAELRERLKAYEDAEASGRLVVLPCKVGDIVYGAETSPVIPLHVIDPAVYMESTEGGDFETLDNFGKTVFLTREEAEAALKGGGADAR